MGKLMQIIFSDFYTSYFPLVLQCAINNIYEIIAYHLSGIAI